MWPPDGTKVEVQPFNKKLAAVLRCLGWRRGPPQQVAQASVNPRLRTISVAGLRIATPLRQRIRGWRHRKRAARDGRVLAVCAQQAPLAPGPAEHRRRTGGDLGAARRRVRCIEHADRFRRRQRVGLSGIVTAGDGARRRRGVRRAAVAFRALCCCNESIEKQRSSGSSLRSSADVTCC